ncbi:cellulose binding domain-containing protein [Actinoallomurus rhizosphaericola]|uniref:cellulose binding domain-containing protein n=1 Tax=Actinoallomurus rhizosphaericola TaxID=2952536 RepID=UPI002091D07E|nr:cellulose binding domain-containing protein [Actinoallomurus rhizosphaericola]MCO5992029.1 cellulose-binding domain-containing protein [Actinoallomurus rhizosphaericola]
MGDRDGEEVLPHLRATEEIPRPARPVPATDVQLRPVVPPPGAPATVQESVPASYDASMTIAEGVPTSYDAPMTVAEGAPARFDAPPTVEQGVPTPPPGPYGTPATVEEPLPYAGEQGAPLPPGAPRRSPDPAGTGGRVSRRLALIVGGAAVLLAAVGILVVAHGTSSGPVKAPAPCGHGPCPSSPTHDALTPAAQVAYRTVERDAGYFEGTVTIANHGDRPMRSWTLSFTYPGADIHNTWDAVLQRRGAETVLTGKPTSPPIAPGASLQVRFGGSGAPSMPTGCRLNGAPCAFVAG